MTRETRFHEFGEFRFDATNRRLWRGNQRVPLGQKAADALLRLLERPGELVKKDELIVLLWPDTVVEENNLNQQISALRRALGETAEQPRHIITVPGRGYRFIPEQVGDELPAARPIRWALLGLMIVAALAAGVAFWQIHGWRSANANTIRSVAVLPLRSVNSAVGDEHFGLGIADAIIRNLTAFEGVMVRPTDAVRRYAETPADPTVAGRALSVDAVLDGTVQRDGNRLRVSVQLVRVENGASVWTKHFDTDWGNIFSVQDEVASQVARALALQLKGGGATVQHPRRPTADPEAYAAYLKSRYFWNKRSADGYLKGIEHAQSAVTRDPAFAQAYAAMADCYALLGSSPDSTIERGVAMNRARQASERSLALDPSSAEATTSLAFVKMHYDWDWTAAERLFLDALRLDPEYATAHHWYAYFLTARQRHGEAITHIGRAHELDPLSVIIATDLGELLLYAGRVDESITAARAALELDPAFVHAHRVLAWADMRRGNYNRALETLQAVPKFSGAHQTDLLGTLGHLYGLLGRRQAAEEVVKALKRHSALSSELGVNLSATYAGLGAKDDAFYWLEQSFRARSGSLIMLLVEPMWAPLREDPRFTDLARRLGLRAAD